MTPKVPPIDVFPVVSATTNLSVSHTIPPLAFNSPVNVVSPVTPKVLDNVVAPVTPKVPPIEVFPTVWNAALVLTKSSVSNNSPLVVLLSIVAPLANVISPPVTVRFPATAVVELATVEFGVIVKWATLVFFSAISLPIVRTPPSATLNFHESPASSPWSALI